MNDDVIGVLISKKDYDEFQMLKKKNTPMKKIVRHNTHCPICDYVVDNVVPDQLYCDRCGQRLVK